jgi:adenylate cyclase
VKSQAREAAKTLLLADLSGYTALTETHGALRAADIVERFGQLVEASLEPGVTVIDRIGDGVLCAAPDTLAIVLSALRLSSAVRSESGFPTVRSGMHHGPVLERNGKLFGAPLNLAARISAVAAGGQILCTEPVARAARAIPGVGTRSLGKRRFKNVASAVALFELLPAGEIVNETVIDPVCHMQVAAGSATRSVEFRGRSYRFCSPDCARQFAEMPARFARP